jgi:inhibitor of the pro-sigma K processing machinery
LEQAKLLLTIPGIAAVLLIGLLFWLLRKPIKLAFKILLHAAFGYLFLLIFNYFGSRVGLSLDVNWVTAIITGALGIPGVILLLLLHYIL